MRNSWVPSYSVWLLFPFGVEFLDAALILNVKHLLRIGSGMFSQRPCVEGLLSREMLEWGCTNFKKWGYWQVMGLLEMWPPKGTQRPVLSHSLLHIDQKVSGLALTHMCCSPTQQKHQNQPTRDVTSDTISRKPFAFHTVVISYYSLQ